MSLVNPAVYLLNKIYVGWVIFDTGPELYQKNFFMKKRMNGILANVMEFMLTFYEMQNTRT